MATRGEHRLRNTLVVAQVALAFVMLAVLDSSRGACRS